MSEFDDEVGGWVRRGVPTMERKVKMPLKKRLKSKSLTKLKRDLMDCIYFLMGSSSLCYQLATKRWVPLARSFC